MGIREEVVEVDSFNSPIGNYVATYGALALALIALSISALVSIPGGYLDNKASFYGKASFKLYYIASFICFGTSMTSLLTLLLLKFNTNEAVEKTLEIFSFCCIHVSILSLVVVATAIEFLINGGYSLLIVIGPVVGIHSAIILYYIWNWLVRITVRLKNATVWICHMLKNATVCVSDSLKNATL
uniref:PGG domain-containing protein n=1 Tax=Cannabis sativa TaxID=3483 RepID=A0A803PZP1_CANSA